MRLFTVLALLYIAAHTVHAANRFGHLAGALQAKDDAPKTTPASTSTTSTGVASAGTTTTTAAPTVGSGTPTSGGIASGGASAAAGADSKTVSFDLRKDVDPVAYFRNIYPAGAFNSKFVALQVQSFNFTFTLLRAQDVRGPTSKASCLDGLAPAVTAYTTTVNNQLDILSAWSSVVTSNVAKLYPAAGGASPSLAQLADATSVDAKVTKALDDIAAAHTALSNAIKDADKGNCDSQSQLSGEQSALKLLQTVVPGWVPETVNAAMGRSRARVMRNAR